MSEQSNVSQEATSTTSNGHVPAIRESADEQLRLIIQTPEGEKVYYAEEFGVEELSEEEAEFGDDANTVQVTFGSDQDVLITEAFAIEASRDFELASIRGVPEFKVEWVKVKIAPGIYIKRPVAYTRRAKYTAYARIKSGEINTNALWNTARDCAVKASRDAGIAGVLAAFLSAGSAAPAAFVAAFLASMKRCLTAKGGKLAAAASGVKVKVFLTKESEIWSKV